MTTTKPTPEEIKRALLHSAKTLFLRDGIAATEMKAIAENAGLSRSTLYRYMIDKNQLAFLVAAEVLQDIANPNMIFTANGQTNGFEKLSQFSHLFLDTLCDNVSLVSFLSEFDSIFRSDYPSIPEAQEYILTINRMLHRTAQFLFEGLADGSVRELEDPLFYTSLLINTVFGLAERMLPRDEHYMKEHKTTARRVLESSVNILLDHIKA